MMKPNKKNLVIAVSFLFIGIISTSVVWVYATPATIFYISGGFYPSAPDYTIWRESTTYYAKNGYGRIGVNYGTNLSTLLASISNPDTHFFFKSGTYVLSTVWSIFSNSIIEGEGNSTIFSLTSNSYFYVALGSSGTQIKNLQINGNIATNIGYGIQVSGDNTLVKNCYIHHTSYPAVLVWSSSGNQIINNWLADVSNSSESDPAIRVEIATETLIFGNTITRGYESGIRTYDTSNSSRIIGNNLDSCGMATSFGQIHSAGGDYDVIMGNTLRNSPNNGINLHKTEFATVTGNTIINTTLACIRLDDANYNTINSNTFGDGIGQNGIVIADSSNYNTFGNHVIVGAGSYGIFEVSGDYNSFVNCNSWGASTANLLLSGANSECHSSFNGTTWIT